MGRAVRLDIGAVDGGAFRDRARGGERLDKVQPEPLARPSVKAVVDRCRRAVLLRAITPAASDLEYMDDARDHGAVINAASARLVHGHMRLDHRPLLVRQPKQMSHSSLQITDWTT